MHISFSKWSVKGLVLVLALTAGIVLYPPPASATGTLNDGLVSYWTLDEQSGTRVDSADSNDFTDNNTVGAVLHGPVGPVGNFITPALHEYVPTQLQKENYNTGTSTGNFSLAAWVNLDEAQKADPAWIAGFYSDGDGWPLAYLYWSGTKFQFKVYDQTNAEEATVELDPPPGGGWRLIVGRYTSADITLHLSADAGTEVTQALGEGGQRQSFGSKAFRIGAEETVDTYFTGQIGPVGLWTGTSGAISDSQRTSIFNSGNGKLYADLSTADKVGLTGWWNLTEVSGSRADSIGTPLGTLADTYVSSVDGVANPGSAMDGNAASFAAADSEYLSKTSPSGLDGTGDFTMAVWFKYTADPAAGALIFGSEDGTGAYITHQSGYVKGFVYDAVDESYYGTGEALDEGDRNWHLALLQYTSADITVSFSLDNGAFTTETLDTGPRGVNSGTVFAGGNGTAEKYLDGLVDEAAIWSRALTTDERTELYNDGAGTFYPFAPPTPPDATTAELQNKDATLVNMVVTGTGFDIFASSSAVTANASDLASISYGGSNPASASITSDTTLIAAFNIADIGTGRSGGPLTIGANTLVNPSANATITIADDSITDLAIPLLAPVVIQSNDPDLPFLAHPGETVTLSFTSSETIHDPTAVDIESGLDPISADRITVASAGNDWTIEYTVSGGDTSGFITFGVGFGDLDGNTNGINETDALPSAVAVDGANAEIRNDEGPQIRIVINVDPFLSGLDTLGAFTESASAGAATLDLASISYGGVNPTSASITADNTIDAIFPIGPGALGTGKIPGPDPNPLLINPGTFTNGASTSGGIAITESQISDAAVPLAMPVGDGSVDVTIAASCGIDANPACPELDFSEPINAESRTAVETALMDGADQLLGFEWTASGSILTIAGIPEGTTHFPGNVFADVSDAATPENTSAGLFLINSAPPVEFLLNGNTPLVIGDDEALVEVGAGATAGSLDVSGDVGGILPHIVIIADSVGGGIGVEIPSGVTVTGDPGWDGATINVPTIKSNGSVTVSGGTVNGVMEIGFDATILHFDRGVRIFLAGHGGDRIGYSHGGAVTEITDPCASDSQATGNALGIDGDCKIDVSAGVDLVVWTKHFSSFVTFTTASVRHGGSGSYVAVAPTPTPTTPAGGPAHPSDYGLKEGDTVSAPGSSDPDIYIVNEWGYKRLFLNPVIFNFYGHLKGWSAVKGIPATTRDAFPTSGLFRNCETDDQAVYAVQVTGEDTGILHHVNLSGDQAVAQDPAFFHKVFCINTNEFNWYTKGADYTSLSQVPVYTRAAQPLGSRVKVISTVAYLNVRSTPSTSGTLITKLQPNEIVGYVETSGGWYKVQKDGADLGWVSGLYVTVVQ